MTVDCQPSESPPPSASPCAASTPTCIRCPSAGELAQYIPEPWRSKYFTDRAGRRPDLLRRPGLRALLRDAGRTAFPPDGEFACSDPDMALQQLIMEAGADIAILEPAAYPARLRRGQPRDELRVERLAGQPLAGQPQQLARALARFHLRSRSRHPEDAAREIETLGRAPLHGADPDQGRAAAVMGRSRATTRSGQPPPSTTSR